jgi:hypothetical protein
MSYRQTALRWAAVGALAPAFFLVLHALLRGVPGVPAAVHLLIGLVMPMLWPSSLMFLGTPDIFTAPGTVALSVAINVAIYIGVGSLLWRIGVESAAKGSDA